MADERMIAALLRERAALASQGKDDRVSQVDEQLKLRGYETEKEEPRKQAPQGRSARPKQATAKPDEV